MRDLVATVTTAIGLCRQLIDLASVAKDASAKLVVAELQLQLAEIKVRLAELIDENANLKDAIKQATSTVPEVIVKDGLYFRPDGDGPFCTACFDKDGQLIRLAEMARTMRHFGRWRCHVCTGKYQ